MRTLLVILLLGLTTVRAEETAKKMGTVHLYGYLNQDWLPFADAELISVKPGLVHFKFGSQVIEHSGCFSVTQAVPKKEKKWWQFGSAPTPERVSLVILYGFMKVEMMPFRDADIYEKGEGFIVFDFGDTRYTHCGKYSIQR